MMPEPAARQIPGGILHVGDRTPIPFRSRRIIMRYLLSSAMVLLTCGVMAPAADTKWAVATLTTTQMTDVKRIMSDIEQRADRFETEFLKGLRSSTVKIEERDKYRQWVDALEDQLDNMAEAYHENNINEAQEELRQAMEAARNLNQFMLNAKWSPEAETLWRGLRDDLNKLAGHHKAPAAILIIASK